MDIEIAGHRFRLIVTERDGRWRAHAVRVDGGDQFGPEETGATEHEACERLSRWIAWQHEHAAALEALQAAERTYHRSVAGAAFAADPDAGAGADLRRESLEQPDAARTRLDEIRARRPA
jgi:hypothetical protein